VTRRSQHGQQALLAFTILTLALVSEVTVTASTASAQQTLRAKPHHVVYGGILEVVQTVGRRRSSDSTPHSGVGGHELYFAKNGEEAMRVFMRRTPDVVVTDLKMPGGDGIELIEALVGMFPDVKVVSVTGAVTDMLDTAKMMGARATLTKPVSPQSLLKAVAQVLSTPS